MPPSSESLTAKPCRRDDRAERRREAFLKAAREVFVEHGYENANMAEIVKKAGGSLSTLYAQYGDKQGLFFAVLNDRVKNITADMQLQLDSHTPVREGLTHIGEHFARQTLTADSLAIYRLMVSLAARFPDITKRFQSEGAGQLREVLAAYLEDRAAAGEIKLDEPLAMASVFLDLSRSGLSARALADISYIPSENEIQTTVARSVSVFLAAYGQT